MLWWIFEDPPERPECTILRRRNVDRLVSLVSFVLSHHSTLWDGLGCLRILVTAFLQGIALHRSLLFELTGRVPKHSRSRLFTNFFKKHFSNMLYFTSIKNLLLETRVHIWQDCRCPYLICKLLFIRTRKCQWLRTQKVVTTRYRRRSVRRLRKYTKITFLYFFTKYKKIHILCEPLCGICTCVCVPRDDATSVAAFSCVCGVSALVEVAEIVYTWGV